MRETILAPDLECGVSFVAIFVGIREGKTLQEIKYVHDDSGCGKTGPFELK